MNNHSWNHQYFENSSKELHTNIFRSLEIEQYLQKTLKDNGFRLQNHKINFLHSKINILLSVCKLKQKNLQLNKITNHLNLKKSKVIQQIQKYQLLSQKSSTKKKLQTLIICQSYKNKVKLNKLKESNLENLSNKLLTSLKNFTKNKQDIYLTIKEINFVNSKEETKQTLKALLKFKKTSFFKEGEQILTPIVTQNSAKLLSNFIAIQLRNVKKQHNFFLNFLQESLKKYNNSKLL